MFKTRVTEMLSIEYPIIQGAMIPCGQVVGLIHEIPTAGEIIEDIIDEAKLIGQRLNNIGILVERR